MTNMPSKFAKEVSQFIVLTSQMTEQFKKVSFPQFTIDLKERRQLNDQGFTLNIRKST
jgi:hypothetical protein